MGTMRMQPCNTWDINTKYYIYYTYSFIMHSFKCYLYSIISIKLSVWFFARFYIYNVPLPKRKLFITSNRNLYVLHFLFKAYISQLAFYFICFNNAICYVLKFYISLNKPSEL